MALQDNKTTGSSVQSAIIRTETLAAVKNKNKHMKVFVTELAEKAAKSPSAFVEMI